MRIHGNPSITEANVLPNAAFLKEQNNIKTIERFQKNHPHARNTTKKMAEHTVVELKEFNLFIGPKHLLRDLSFSLKKGQITAFVGRNGSGKTLTALSLLGLLPPGALIKGSIYMPKTLKKGKDATFVIFENPLQ